MHVCIVRACDDAGADDRSECLPEVRSEGQVSECSGKP